ncbi:MAG: sigma-70 family RNA polymerase sigma factor [Myxococcota bacterium]
MSARHPSEGPTELEAIYRRHYGLVRWVLRACGIPERTLDDRTHDVFVALCRRLPDRDPELPVRTWVTGVARNVAFSHRRATARRHRRATQLHPPPDQPPGPDEVLERREAWQALARFLDGLGPEQREVFVMVEVAGMRVSELAASTGAPANTLHSRLKVARTRFREHFADASDRGSHLIQQARRQGQASDGQQRRTWAAVVASVQGADAVPLTLASTDAVAKSTGLGATLVALGAATATLGLVAVATVRPFDPAPAPSEPPGHASRGTDRPGPAGTPPSIPPSILAPPSASEPVDPEHPAEIQAVGSARERPPSRQRSRARTSTPTMAPSPAPAPTPKRIDDDLVGSVQALERARRALRAGRASQALAIVDALGAHVGMLDRERRRLELEAACATGNTARARDAAHALARLGVTVDLSDPCAPIPAKTPATDR